MHVFKVCSGIQSLQIHSFWGTKARCHKCEINCKQGKYILGTLKFSFNHTHIYLFYSTQVLGQKKINLGKKNELCSPKSKVLCNLPVALHLSDVSTGFARYPHRPHSSAIPLYTFLRFEISAWHIIPLTAWYSRNNFIFKHLSRQVLCMREMGFEQWWRVGRDWCH